MKAIRCSTIRDELAREWSGIVNNKGSTETLKRWSAAEPALTEFVDLSEVVNAIAVPIGQSYDRSLGVTQAVVRLAAEDESGYDDTTQRIVTENSSSLGADTPDWY